MTMQTVSLSQLIPSKANPRKMFDAKSLEGLAASIRTDGVLQNLVVKPMNGKGKRYAIITGERRYRALKLLEDRAELPDGFTIPVEIRSSLTKDESLRIAAVENLQRQNLTPLEETAALTKLIRKGVTLEEVAAQTGLSPSTIKRRLALNSLSDDGRKALEEGEISLAQAEALTLANDTLQSNILEHIRSGHDCSADDIKDMVLDERPSVALAIFPREQYAGTITTDLFGEEESSYFDDVEQFFDLQRTAVEALADDYRSKAAWVEVTEHYHVPIWQYRKADEGEQGGVIINFAPTGKVEIHESLIRHEEIDEDAAEETAENPVAPKRLKASYSAPLRRYIAHHKTLAVQELLLANPRKAKEVAAVRDVLDLRVHAALPTFAELPRQPLGYGVLEALARSYAAKLGLEIGEGEGIWDCFPPPDADDVPLYEAVKHLSDHELDELHVLLAALRFGQENCDALDCRQSLFNAVAQDLGADLKNHWQPDAGFFERRNKEQLLEIAQECGYADLHGSGRLKTYKKTELVSGLVRHFELAHEAEQPNEAQAKALAWLPEVMHFPAIDPAATRGDEPADD